MIIAITSCAYVTAELTSSQISSKSKNRSNKLTRKPTRNRDDELSLTSVAKYVGYSTATVSRALNNQPGVSEKVREKIIDACKELSYLPNSAAQALRLNKTKIIGTIIPTLNHSIYARMVEGLQKHLAQNDFALLHTTCEYNQQVEYQQAITLIKRGVEGLVLVGNKHNPDLHKILKAKNIPYVNTYIYSKDVTEPCVGFENSQAVYQMTDFLLQLGHQKFAMITGKRDNNDRVEARISGARNRLKKEQLDLPNHLIIEAPYTIEGGYAAMKALETKKNDFTALICGSDILAFGALSACKDLGISVPKDLSIVGFDNLEFSAHLSPPLTTIDVPATEMGQKAAGYLINKLKNKNNSAEKIKLKTTIILRETTGKPRQI